MTKIAFSVHNLGFKFTPEQRCFFKDLSLELEAGKLHFLRGENGSGKSTLLRLLQGGVDKGEQVLGSIEIEGHAAKLNEMAVRANKKIFERISLVPQKFDEMLANQLSFEENLSLANMDAYPSLKCLPLYQTITGLLERFKIDQKKPVYLLSGGQRQILSIVMALQKKVSILLLDEPTAALDDQNAEMVMQFLQELASTQGLTILIISHDRELIKRYAQDGHFELVVDREFGPRTLRRV